MSNFYSDHHRALQDAFDSRRLADLIENAIIHRELAEHEIAFVQSRDMFFLSTIDQHGRPTVSYKGGAPGFVRVVAPGRLAFPWYDGNGMFYSAGNLAGAPKVGLLFIDFATPNRLRVQGDATLVMEGAKLSEHPGAQFLVEVAIETVWVNCPRYIHEQEKRAQSKYVPGKGAEAPLPGWKRIDVVQPALPAKDRDKVAGAGGEITQEAYGELLGKGKA